MHGAFFHLHLRPAKVDQEKGNFDRRVSPETWKEGEKDETDQGF